jgi:N-acetylglutamate synthase-like GNAT family acetyltransferase
MGDIVVRTFEPADIAETGFRGERPATGLTIEKDGKVAASGGIHRFNGRYWVFFNLKDEAMRRPFVLHRLCRRGLALAAKIGMSEIYALCETSRPRSREWLNALGFRRLSDDEKDDEIRLLEAQRGDEAWRLALQ